MRMTEEQFQDFCMRWANPTGENIQFSHWRFGQAFMNWFKIESLISPVGDVWEIYDKDEVKKLREWLHETFVEKEEK